MNQKKILFIYRTRRQEVYAKWKKGKSPDGLLFGFNHLKKRGLDADFYDDAYRITNIFHPLFYILEHAITATVGMGFKLDQAFYLLPKIKNADIIVATGDSAGLPVLALKYHGLINKPIIFMTAGLAGALKGKENSWVGNYYKKILRVPDVFTAYSQVEIDFFVNKMKIPRNKIRYMPLGTDWQYFSRHPKKKIKKNIICAVGVDSGRDYQTLFKAVEGLPYKVEVACHLDNIRGLEIPDNVTVHINIPISKVKEIFDRSMLSIVPCYERFRSAGQMVILESGSAGLPVIASKIRGITGAFNFVDKKEILYFEPENHLDLRRKIIYLAKNQKVAAKLGKNISQNIKNNYTTQNLAKNLNSFLNNLDKK